MILDFDGQTDREQRQQLERDIELYLRGRVARSEQLKDAVLRFDPKSLTAAIAEWKQSDKMVAATDVVVESKEKKKGVFAAFLSILPGRKKKSASSPAVASPPSSPTNPSPKSPATPSTKVSVISFVTNSAC